MNIPLWLAGKGGPLIAAFVAGCIAASVVQQWRLGAKITSGVAALAVAQQQHEADKRAIAAEAAAAASAALAETARSAATVADLETQFRKEQHEAQQTIDALRTDVRNGDVRLRVAVAGCASVAGSDDMSGTGTSASGANGAGTAELDRSVADDLLGITADGDAAIRKLTALQDYAREALRVCGAH